MYVPWHGLGWMGLRDLLWAGWNHLASQIQPMGRILPISVLRHIYSARQCPAKIPHDSSVCTSSRTRSSIIVYKQSFLACSQHCTNMAMLPSVLKVAHMASAKASLYPVKYCWSTRKDCPLSGAGNLLLSAIRYYNESFAEILQILSQRSTKVWNLTTSPHALKQNIKLGYALATAHFHVQKLKAGFSVHMTDKICREELTCKMILLSRTVHFVLHIEPQKGYYNLKRADT